MTNRKESRKETVRERDKRKSEEISTGETGEMRRATREE